MESKHMNEFGILVHELFRNDEVGMFFIVLEKKAQYTLSSAIILTADLGSEAESSFIFADLSLRPNAFVYFSKGSGRA